MPALQRRCSSWSRHNGYPVVMPRPRRATRAWHDFTWCFSTAGCSPSPASRRMRVPLAGLADVLASIRRLPSGNFRLSLSVSLALAGWRLGSTPRYRQRRAWRILPPYWGGAGAEPDSRPFVILASHIGPPTGKTVVLYGMVVQDIFTAQPERTFLVHRRRVRVVSGVPGPPGDTAVTPSRRADSHDNGSRRDPRALVRESHAGGGREDDPESRPGIHGGHGHRGDRRPHPTGSRRLPWPWFAALAGSSGSRADRDQQAGLHRPPVVLDRPPSPLP
jgi:hypothetical protein